MTLHLALSTSWNGARHQSGEDLVREALDLGFDHLELGYNLRMDLVPGVQAAVAQGRIRADSVHNFCPVPVGAPQGHPELYLLTAQDRRSRGLAVEHISRTVRFAAEVGARVVVLHGGYAHMDHLTHQLITLCQEGRQFTPVYEKIKLKLLMTREKKAPAALQWLRDGLEQLLPVLEECQVRLALENLPAWEAVPNELEAQELLQGFQTPWLGYWHDIGHGQIRETLGLINQDRWLDRLQPWLCGMHIHDVAPPAADHLAPGKGKVDFGRYRKYARSGILLVLELAAGQSGEELVKARDMLYEKWR